MIKNSRQMRAAQRRLDELRDARDSTAGLEAATFVELIRDVEEQLEEFRQITSGDVTAFNFQSLDDLGEILTKVRIARRLTQRELAERLGVSEQMIQRDEAGDYEGAGLARVADAFDALDYKVRGSVGPSEAEPAYFNFPAAGTAERDRSFSSSVEAELTFGRSVGRVVVGPSSGPNPEADTSDTSSAAAELAEAI